MSNVSYHYHLGAGTSDPMSMTYQATGGPAQCCRHVGRAVMIEDIFTAQPILAALTKVKS